MKTELTGYVKIKRENEYQFVYASKDYGTFYCVYARFFLDKKKEILEKIELHIENYKGLLDLGFIRQSIDSKYVFSNDETLKIPIPLKVFNSFQRASIDLKGKNIAIEDIKYLHFKKYLFPQSYKDSQSDQNNCPNFNNTFFDNEFNQRILDVNNPKPISKKKLENGKVIDFNHFEVEVAKLENPVSYIAYLKENFNIPFNILGVQDAFEKKAIGNNCIDSFIKKADN